MRHRISRRFSYLRFIVRLDWYLVEFRICVEISTILFYSKAWNFVKNRLIKDLKNRFQDNYKVNRITSVEAILQPYFRRLVEHAFVLYGTSMCNRLEELWIKLLLKLPGIFKEIDGTLPSVSLCQNIILVPRVIKKKKFFCSPLIAIRCAGNEIGQNSSMFYL